MDEKKALSVDDRFQATWEGADALKKKKSSG